MKAVIMAAGKGTRLGALAHAVPKPMTRIGGTPILEHQIKLLKRYGVTEIIIVTGHLGEQIETYFGDGSEHDVSITYFRNHAPLLGTAGGVKEVETLLTEDFVVLYGDVMIDMDLRRLIEFHREKQSDCTLVLHPNDHPVDSDLVDINAEQRIIAFHPKPHTEGKYYHNLVNAGAYIMTPKIFSMIEKGKDADFGRDIFPKIYTKMRFYGYNTAEYLKDMGTPQRLAEVERDYASGKVERMNSEHLRKAIFLDRDGVLNEDSSSRIYRLEDLVLIPGVAEAVRKINASEYLAIVITNQPVVAIGLCTMEELKTIHNKLETELGKEHAKLDAIYFCPHHPEKGFPGEDLAYKIDCDCRKPKPGMLLKAAKDFRIDLAGSYFIGDAARDIEAGIAAGVTPIGVRGGSSFAGTTLKNDRVFDTLNESVDFILDIASKKIV